MEINIIAATDKGYRTWIYNRIDGHMLSKIVDAKEASDLFPDGWRMSPAEFSDDEELKNSPEFSAMADDMAQKLNFLLNIDKCEDIVALKEFAKDFLQLKVHHKAGVKKLREMINTKATELDLFEDAGE